MRCGQCHHPAVVGPVDRMGREALAALVMTAGLAGTEALAGVDPVDRTVPLAVTVAQVVPVDRMAVVAPVDLLIRCDLSSVRWSSMRTGTAC